MIGFTLGLIVLFLGKIFYYFVNVTTSKKIKGVLWLLLVIGGISGNTCIIVLGFIEYYTY